MQNFKVEFSILPSAAASPVAAVATAILWGDIILPAVFAAASQNGFKPKDLATSTWSGLNKLIYSLVVWSDHFCWIYNIINFRTFLQ